MLPRGDGDAVETPPTLYCGREAGDTRGLVANQIIDNRYLLVRAMGVCSGEMVVLDVEVRGAVHGRS